MYSVSISAGLVAAATTMLQGCAITPNAIGRLNESLVTQTVPLVPVNHGLQERCVLHERDNPLKTAFFGLQVANARSAKNTPRVVVTGFVNIKAGDQNHLSPARGGGLQGGDIVLSFAGCPVSYGRQLVDLIWRFTPGNTAVIRVERSGQVHGILVTSATVPTTWTPEYPPQQSLNNYWR